MNRIDENPRIKKFEKRHVSENLEFKKDVAITAVDMIDNDGELKRTTKETIIDESESLLKVNPVTTRIEYMKQFGTLDKLENVSYHMARTSDVDKIIDSEKLAKVVNNIKTE